MKAFHNAVSFNLLFAYIPPTNFMMLQGWDAGIIGMQKSGRRFLVIPPHLAYGQKSVSNKIPPNSILAFEVDLLRVS